MQINTDLLSKSSSFKSWVSSRRQEIKELLKEYEFLLQEDAELSKLEKSWAGEEDDEPTPIDPNYLRKWTWVEKISYVLAGKDLTGNEIHTLIMGIEPYLDSKSTYNSIMATLSVHSKDDKTFIVAGNPNVPERKYAIRSEYEYEL